MAPGQASQGLRNWYAVAAVALRDPVARVGSGELVWAQLPGRPTRRVRDFFSRDTWAIAAVDSGPNIRFATLRCASD